MNERFAEKMSDAQVVKDTRLLGDFSVIYCRGNHPGADRVPLTSDGASLGVYGRKLPIVCEECARLLRYAEKRRAFCPKDPKPFCSYCDTHCYSSEMREFMREVMRYAGPRSITRGHAIDSVRHLVEGRRARREAEARASSDQ
ncbi:MAG: nitrous oxide-stimulated promoter family protein [Anaerosomatales bacterium]